MNVLISVFDKTDIEKIAKVFSNKKAVIYSSSGTGKFLTSNGIKIKKLENLTGFSELLRGRVKTLHPAVHAGILAKNSKKDKAELKKAKYPEFDIVITNLYDFPDPEKKTELKKAVELIDIGGQALIRGSAKNFERVAIITSPSQYDLVIEEFEKKGKLSKQTRQFLALKAFEYIAEMDIKIAKFYQKQFNEGFPENFFLSGKLYSVCRYGENPSQKAATYATSNKFLFSFKQLQGKELSYNNYLDFQAAVSSVNDFEKTACAIIKHNTICGFAKAQNSKTAFVNAWSSDPLSAFGSVIAFNDIVDEKIADKLVKYFVEGIAAPGFSEKALEILNIKKNLRLLKFKKTANNKYEIRSLDNGLLLQTPQKSNIKFKVVSQKKPTKKVMDELLFAFKTVKHVKSNAIILTKGNATIGVGGGDVSRVDATQQALKKAGIRSKESILASDAFFPFPDSIELAAKFGIKAVIAPGGSINDKMVINAANRLKISLVFASERQFKH